MDTIRYVVSPVYKILKSNDKTIEQKIKELIYMGSDIDKLEQKHPMIKYKRYTVLQMLIHRFANYMSKVTQRSKDITYKYINNKIKMYQLDAFACNKRLTEVKILELENLHKTNELLSSKVSELLISPDDEDDTDKLNDLMGYLCISRSSDINNLVKKMRNIKINTGRKMNITKKR